MSGAPVSISFPPEEWPAIRARLEEDGFFFTTRVDAELDRYGRGQSLLTPWGDRLRVAEIREYSNIDQHPFLEELTPEQHRLIAGHGRYQVIKLAAE